MSTHTCDGTPLDPPIPAPTAAAPAGSALPTPDGPPTLARTDEHSGRPAPTLLYLGLLQQAMDMHRAATARWGEWLVTVTGGPTQVPAAIAVVDDVIWTLVDADIRNG